MQHARVFTSLSRSWILAIVGIALIVLYSILMIANSGDAPWAWLLLLLGVAALVAGGRSRSRADD